MKHVNKTLEVNPEQIVGFKLYRSPSNQRLFNVVAYGKKEELLAVVETDLQFDEAAELVEVLNAGRVIEDVVA